MRLVRFKDLPAMPEMGCTIKFLFPSEVDMIFAVLSLKEGESFPSHMHKICKEVYYITKGKALLTVGDETREVGAGEGILIPPGNYHTIRNAGKESVELVAVRAPNIPGDSYAKEEKRDRTWRDILANYIKEVSAASK